MTSLSLSLSEWPERDKQGKIPAMLTLIAWQIAFALVHSSAHTPERTSDWTSYYWTAAQISQLAQLYFRLDPLTGLTISEHWHQGVLFTINF